MRAAVTKQFHHPVTGVMLQIGDELIDDDLKPVLADGELIHRVAVTSRLEQEPNEAAPPSVKPQPYVPPAPSPEVKE